MLNYVSLTPQQYVDLLVSLISSAEGHTPIVQKRKDGQRTIGYGYTFGRNNNLALWQAAGIALTPVEWGTSLTKLTSASHSFLVLLRALEIPEVVTPSWRATSARGSPISSTR